MLVAMAVPQSACLKRKTARRSTPGDHFLKEILISVNKGGAESILLNWFMSPTVFILNASKVQICQTSITVLLKRGIPAHLYSFKGRSLFIPSSSNLYWSCSNGLVTLKQACIQRRARLRLYLPSVISIPFLVMPPLVRVDSYLDPEDVLLLSSVTNTPILCTCTLGWWIFHHSQ